MNRQLEKILYEKYIKQGIDCRTANYKASEGVRKFEQRKYSKDYFVKMVNNYERLKLSCENIVLRPNDLTRRFGSKGFRNYVLVIEEKLDDYKENDIYRYYYDMKENEHDYYDLELWLKWGRL